MLPTKRLVVWTQETGSPLVSLDLFGFSWVSGIRGGLPQYRCRHLIIYDQTQSDSENAQESLVRLLDASALGDAQCVWKFCSKRKIETRPLKFMWLHPADQLVKPHANLRKGPDWPDWLSGKVI